MLDALRHLLTWTARPLTERYKGNLRLIAGCLFVSSLIWIFNSLNRNHEAKLSVPLEIRYNKAKYMPLRLLPKHAIATVEGYGWHVFRTSSFEKHHKIILWLKHPGLHSQLDTAIFREYLEQHLTSDLEVKHVLVDSLDIPFDLKASKWLHMKVDKKSLSFDSGYELEEPIAFQPDSVLVSGPNSMLNKISDTVLVHIPYKKLDKNFSENIKLSYLFHNPTLVLSHNKVKVQFGVKKKQGNP
jgi:hypothetical protein